MIEDRKDCRIMSRECDGRKCCSVTFGMTCCLATRAILRVVVRFPFVFGPRSYIFIIKEAFCVAMQLYSIRFLEHR